MNPKTEFRYTKEGKEFRQKWRVPKAVANHIVAKCKILDEDGRDLFGVKYHNKARVPIELLRTNSVSANLWNLQLSN